jgi:hypothetical protein
MSDVTYYSGWYYAAPASQTVAEVSILYATIQRIVLLLVEASRPLRTKRVPRSRTHWSPPIKAPTLSLLYEVLLTRRISNSLGANLLRSYHSPLVLSASRKCAFYFMDGLRDIFFTELTSLRKWLQVKILRGRFTPKIPLGYAPVMMQWM